MGQPGRLGPAQLHRQVRNGSLKIKVSVAAFEKFDQMLSQFLVVHRCLLAGWQLESRSSRAR
jgi:hypothetical protein